MRAIAAELGDSPMTPYRYFRNKDEIFAMVRTDAYRRFADAQEAAFLASEEPLERLLRMREAYFESALTDADQYRVMFQLDQAPAEHYPELAEQGERAFSYFRRAVESATEAELLEGEPLTIAHLLWAHVRGLVALHLAGKLTLGKTLAELRQEPGAMVAFIRRA
jgi:AcrR family transcriptional regulator